MDNNLLDKYLLGDASEAERIEVMKWVEESESHRAEFLATRKIWDAVLLSDDSIGKIIIKSEKKSVRFRNVIRYAAITVCSSAAVIAGILLIRNTLTTPEEISEPLVLQTLCSPIGKQTESILSDGTKVWLNSGSELEILSTSVNERRVRLNKGEAFLEVAHDTLRPFIVETEYLNIRVLGTTFDVSAYDSSPSVVLVEGSVKVSNAAEDDETLISPGQMFSYNAETGRKTIEDVNTDNYVSWINGCLQFKSAKIEVVLRQLESFFDVNIDCNNPLNKPTAISGDLELRMGIEKAFENLSLLIPMRWHREGDDIKVDIL